MTLLLDLIASFCIRDMKLSALQLQCICDNNYNACISWVLLWTEEEAEYSLMMLCDWVKHECGFNGLCLVKVRKLKRFIKDEGTIAVVAAESTRWTNFSLHSVKRHVCFLTATHHALFRITSFFRLFSGDEKPPPPASTTPPRLAHSHLKWFLFLSAIMLFYKCTWLGHVQLYSFGETVSQ